MNRKYSDDLAMKCECKKDYKKYYAEHIDAIELKAKFIYEMAKKSKRATYDDLSMAQELSEHMVSMLANLRIAYANTHRDI